MQKRKLEELNLLDDFLFGTMVTYPEVGEAFVKSLLKIILGREFNSLKVIPQKTYYGKDTDKHGARLDVYMEADPDGEVKMPNVQNNARIQAKCSDVYDIEPENKMSSKKILPKRVRFYHAIIDAQSLRSGVEYDSLKNVTVIMIVPFDPFGYDRMVYTITRSCREEPDMPYDDGGTTLYLYTRGKRGIPSEGLKKLLLYMENTTWENAANEDLQVIQKMVETVKNDEEVSIEYMKSWEKEKMIREEGHKAGREEGREEGRREEMANTERERRRAEEAEEKLRLLEEELERIKKR